MAPEAFAYDVALSFAAPDRAAAEELAELLRGKGISIWRDEYTSPGQWGNNSLDHLVNLYARKTRYCVLLLSRHYPLKQWTEAERTDLTQRALREAEEFILPVLLDDSEVLGLSGPAGLPALRRDSFERLASLLAQKLADARTRSGPPPQSHDLRSGNVP